MLPETSMICPSSSIITNNDSNKSKKSNKFKSNDCYYIHFINCVYPSHKKIWFYHLLPSKIQHKINEIIIYGYCKQYKNFKINKIIPTVVLHIIAQYLNY